MRVALLGTPNDPHCQRLSAALAAREVETALIDLAEGGLPLAVSMNGPNLTINGRDARDLGSCFVRSVVSPIPHARAVGQELHLYDEWHVQYMQSREVHGFALSFMLALERQGTVMVNPADMAHVGQLKPHHTLELIRKGFPVPETLITNNPREALSFIAQWGETIYKPVMGGAFARRVTVEDLERIESIAHSPIILQRCIEGDDIRVTLTEDRVLSACKIHSDALDFRASSGYESGRTYYEPVSLPAEIEELCFAALQTSGYRFSGIDLKHVFPNRYYLLECNYAPAYAEIEDRTGHKISEGIAEYLVAAGKRGTRPKSSRPLPFVDYSGNYLPKRHGLSLSAVEHSEPDFSLDVDESEEERKRTATARSEH